MNLLIMLYDLMDRASRRAQQARFRKQQNLNLGASVSIHPSVIISKIAPVFIGDHTYLGPWCYISGPVTLGAGVMVGPRTTFIAADHRTDVIGQTMHSVSSDYQTSPIRVGSDAWIGANCVVLKGVCIGDGAVVGAGSVVTSNLPPYSISVGVPARTIKFRFSGDELRMHLLSLEQPQEMIDKIVEQVTACRVD